MYFDETAWVAVAFILFFVLVWKKGKKAILSLLDERSSLIEKELNEAKSLKEEADNMVPAKIEVGVANVSNKLYIQGMKNAQISTTVAKARIAKTKSFPIQVQPSPN